MYSEKVLDDLNRLILSLKLAQRADFAEDDGNNLINKLYVDPLPNEAIFKQVIQDNTVFLIGRKGTGKSTIFAKAQNHFRNSKNEISIYIDVKTLHGKSIAQDIKIDGENEHVRKLLLLQTFISDILSELIVELEKSLEQKNFFLKLWAKGKYDNVKKNINDKRQSILNPKFLDVSMMINCANEYKDHNSSENVKVKSSNFKGNVNDEGMSVEAGVEKSNSFKENNAEEELRKFSSTLLRHFSIKDYMADISNELKGLGISKVHIFLDDFSEIDFDAQQVFVNTVLAPLNNWSEKFFRFKIAAYPKRIFYGEIDKGKITEIALDYYDVYKVKDLPELEEKAIDFLDRLLKQRFNYYLKVEPAFFFQIDNKENTWDSYKELLFYVSMNVPRILGYILSYCYESSIIYGKKITKSLIEEAAQKYYERQVAYYFEKTNYLAEAFDESLDRCAQEILLNNIIEKSKALKAQLVSESSELFKDIPKGKIPTSHFYIKKGYEKFFYSLELNYFVTKYYEQADRDGITISIYAVNYGLCKSKNIIFGRPKGNTKYRKYYISRFFDFDDLLEKYLLGQVKYVCMKCGAAYEFNEYDTLEKIGMLCYKGCRENNCIKERYYFDNENIFKNINKEILLGEMELDILHVLYRNFHSKLYPTLIARELDCSYQLVSKKAMKLIEKGLITKANLLINGDSRSVYIITEKAIKIYFENNNK